MKTVAEVKDAMLPSLPTCTSMEIMAKGLQIHTTKSGHKTFLQVPLANCFIEMGRLRSTAK